MDLLQIREALLKIKGVTFASLDAVTEPSPGITKVTKGEDVLLYNSRTSGYEKLVKRRIAEAGGNPDSFDVGDLPWGSRIAGEPPSLIFHRNAVYLQCIVLRPGNEQYFFAGRPISGDRFKRGEPPVKVHCYKLSAITGLRLMGESLK